MAEGLARPGWLETLEEGTVISKEQWNAPGCLHLGARPLAFCYCGAMVSRDHFARVADFREQLQMTAGRGWSVVRDEHGLAQRMEWRA